MLTLFKFPNKSSRATTNVLLQSHFAFGQDAVKGKEMSKESQSGRGEPTRRWPANMANGQLVLRKLSTCYTLGKFKLKQMNSEQDLRSDM